MADHSDNSTSRMNLLKYLEGTSFDTDVNKSVIENTFNRFLTKDDTVELIGVVGRPDPALRYDRMLSEPDVHRQTYQLQPLAHHKSATVDHLLSFKDILSKLERMGVDLDRLSEWGSTERFNFIPPVDLDKLVNYRDYYWYDPEETHKGPQYVVMQSPCRVATSQLAQRQRDLAGIGQRLAITAVNLSNNAFEVANDVSNVFLPGTVFDVGGIEAIEGQYTVTSVTYTAGKTHIVVAPQIPSPLFNGGYITFDSQIAELTAKKNLACDNSSGWDVNMWDDAIQSTTSNAELTSPVLLNFIRDEAPSAYELIIQRHPEYIDGDGNIIAVDARPMWAWMDGDKPEFNAGWDSTGSATQLNGWQVDNRWVHKLDLPPGGFSKATRAEAPILEYLPMLQLNEWSEIRHDWLYRADPHVDEFQPALQEPTYSDYTSSDFHDKWAYVGVRDARPTEPQPENTGAVVMSTDLAASTRLLTYKRHVINDVSGSVITIQGSVDASIGSSVVIYNGIKLTSTTVVDITSTDDNTTIRHSGVPFATADSLLFVPRSHLFDVALFPTHKRQQVLAEQNLVRAYIDAGRVYNIDSEIVHLQGGNFYTAGVQLAEPVAVDRIFEIGIDPAAASDVDRTVWWVRSAAYTNDREYEDAGKPTVAVCVHQYVKHEQVKDIGEFKIPLFDLYNVDGSPAHIVNQIFFYALDQAVKVNKHVGLRLKTSEAGEVYHFEQMLISEDNGPMLCYKDKATVTTSNPHGLQTIWRTSQQTPYVPKVVDVNRRSDGEVYYDTKGIQRTAMVDRTNGDWEILSQLKHNPSHENRRMVNSIELFEHIKTINQAQVTPSGFLPSKYNFRLVEDVNYGLGGTIHEHNGTFDLLTSALMVDDFTPIDVVDFARSAYDMAISWIVEHFTTNLPQLLMDKDPVTLGNLAKAASRKAITAYELNDNHNLVFGDSTTWEDGKGIRGWPATLPFLGVVAPTKPVHLVDVKLNINQIIHHDGHINSYTLDPADVKGAVTQLVRQEYIDGSSSVRTYGWTPTHAADGGNPVSNPLTIVWERLRPGDLWLNGDTLLRFSVISIGSTAPTVDVDDGSLWVKAPTGQLMVKQTVDDVGVWTEYGSQPGDVSAAWTTIDLSGALIEVVLDVETRLYEAAAAKPRPQPLPKTLYVRTTEDVDLYNAKIKESFESYVASRKITSPYASGYVSTDPFTWNLSDVEIGYGSSGNLWTPYVDSTRSVEWSGHWAAVYLNVYGTRYPHLEPWKLQGYRDKPAWWDAEYADSTGTRRWSDDMWKNVIANRIPVGVSAPASVQSIVTDPSTGKQYQVMQKVYNYVPVNTSREITTITGAVIYNLDDLFPLYDSRLFAPTNSDIVSGGIGMPMIRRPEAMVAVDVKAPYVFGDMSPIEMSWATSTDRLYDEVVTAFIMQPIRTFNALWGLRTTTVGGLAVDLRTRSVPRHQDVIFHGDVLDGGTYRVDGLNQWYVNYMRQSGLDFKTSGFRSLWTEWDVKLAYQFSGFIDTRTFRAATTAFDLVRDDYKLVYKRSPGIDSVRADGLRVTVANYGNYRTFGGLKVPTGNGVDWDFIISAPTAVQSVEYYGVRKFEFEVVDLDQGIMELTSGQLPWGVATEVHLSTSQYAPYPLDTAWSYFIIPVSDTRFKLSRKKSDAVQGIGTVLRTIGTGVHMIYEVTSTFATEVSGAAAMWHHTAVDKTQLLTTSLPVVIRGVQGVIDFVDGYAARLRDRGIVANHTDSPEIDDSGRLVSWHTEMEHCIERIYTGIGVNNTKIKHHGAIYEIQVRDPTVANGVLRLLNVEKMPFGVGDEVYVFTAGTVPSGLALNTAYYAIPVQGSSTELKLATTPENAYAGISVDISADGIGKHFIGTFPGQFGVGETYADINPFRNSIWLETPRGIVANVFTGGSNNNRSNATVYDLDGRPLPKGSVVVLRQDKLTRVAVRTVDGASPFSIGGVHFFVDGYEHVAIFNDYTTSGHMVFDPFIGMDVNRVAIGFSRGGSSTMRPSLGGYYIDGAEILRNPEACVTDMRHYYDANGGASAAAYLEPARQLLGYEDPSYLDHLNVSDRTKFLFWRGMIHNKGAKRTIAAFINSKHFVDAKIDDFWAYKVADFGDCRPKYKPEMVIRTSDTYNNDLRYEFVGPGSSESHRFAQVIHGDGNRWVDQLEMTTVLSNAPMFFDAEVVTTPVTVFVADDGSTCVETLKRLESVAIRTANGVASVAGGELVPINDRVFKIASSQHSVGIVCAEGLHPALSKVDPITVIDKKVGVTVATTKLWDPINGHHYHMSLKDVDYMQPTPPTSLNLGWTQSSVGTIWVDTSTLGYTPYDDVVVYPTFDDRMARWGRLAAWASVSVYEWVRSTRSPDEFATAWEQEEGNANLAPSERASGQPYKQWHRTSTDEVVETAPVHCYGINVSMTVDSMRHNLKYAGLSFEVYVNGISVGNYLSQDDLAAPGCASHDYVTFVPRVPEDQVGFEERYQYTTVTEVTPDGVESIVYYFWARSRKVANNDHLSADNIARLIERPNAPYHVYMNHAAATNELPDRYTQVVVRGVAQQINEDNRYVLQMTKDYTLRDGLETGKSELDLKNKHTEWVLFRESQPYKISQVLWDKMSEALIGYKISGFDQGERHPVPSLQRTIYDTRNGTTTRFGMREDQAFVDREVGLQTVQSLIRTADFDTAPIDKYVFLEKYTFDTPVNIRNSLQYIFSNFSDQSVNRMFFEVMHDALAGKNEFTGLFMTSFLALHGIKILETSGDVAD